jgi:cofilin
MSSGVAVDAQCLEAFNDLKLHRRHRFIIYGLSDDGQSIVVKKTAAPTDDGLKAAYESFARQNLPADDCRYVVYDFEYQKEPGLKRNKIVFLVWSPSASRVKAKMMYASSKDALRKRLDGIAVEVQATDADEASYDSVLDKVRLF